MWLRTDGYGMTDGVLAQVAQEVPDAPSVRPGDCATWLNLETGARVLHVQFGEPKTPGGFHGVFFRAPNGELSDIAHPIAGLVPFEMKYVYGDPAYVDINIYRWRQVNHRIEVALGLRNDTFDDEWPGDKV